MFIAHLPAGYLTARFVAQRLGLPATPGLVLAGLAGGIFPDIAWLPRSRWERAGNPGFREAG